MTTLNEDAQKYHKLLHYIQTAINQGQEVTRVSEEYSLSAELLISSQHLHAGTETQSSLMLHMSALWLGSGPRWPEQETVHWDL